MPTLLDSLQGFEEKLKNTLNKPVQLPNSINPDLTKQVPVPDDVQFAGFAQGMENQLASIMQKGAQEFLDTVKKGSEGNVIWERARKTVSGTNDATMFHGTGGLFTNNELDRNIVSSIVRPEGILAILPAVGVIRRNMNVGMLTGYTKDAQGRPNTVCADAPSGTYDGCQINFTWGRLAFDTNSMVFNEIGLRLNEGDTDLMLMNSFLSNDTGRLRMRNITEENVLNIVIRSEMAGVATLFERELTAFVWQGDPANNVGTGHLEPEGLELQIVTGILDIDSNPCPDMDSLVRDWSFTDVGAENASYDNQNLYTFLEDTEHYLWDQDRRTMIGPVNRIIVMNTHLWRALTQVLPCIMHDGCTAGAGITDNTLSARLNTEERERIRAAQSLNLNGRTYPVFLDDGPTELTNADDPVNLPTANDYASSIFFLPLTIRGGFPVTYIEYIDYQRTEFVANLSPMGPRMDFWSDGGVFSWTVEQLRWCFKLGAQLEWRVILRTPHLAARINNVKYTTQLRVRQPVLVP